MDTLSTIDRVLTRVIEGLMVVLFGMFLVIVVTKVLMRPFDMAIYGVDEQVKIAFLCTSALGGAVAITKREHIAITFFIDLMPYYVKMAFYVAGLVLVGVMNAALVWLSFDWIAGPGRNMWQPFGMPQGYVFIIVPISCAIAVFYCFVRVVLTLGGRDSIDVLWMPED
ncbi:TRAP transporter small permease [Ruegeria sp. EL01]|jgi:TRAP-type C4-dicarboxylate transport system permease small subunit|uniref:TRAP transporter small permease n=1 Tax=Ruegeria sp. EL01 TaxID=2107578 RepID=UPI000EA82CDE|nr:TRAP transporter small permease subunit [Ruegeria sp. EL01]